MFQAPDASSSGCTATAERRPDTQCAKRRPRIPVSQVGIFCHFYADKMLSSAIGKALNFTENIQVHAVTIIGIHKLFLLLRSVRLPFVSENGYGF